MLWVDVFEFKGLVCVGFDVVQYVVCCVLFWNLCYVMLFDVGYMLYYDQFEMLVQLIEEFFEFL